MKTEKNYKSSIKITASQILPVLVKNLLMASFGMTIGYPTILIANLSKPTSGEKMYLDEEQISWIGSINMLSLPIGCVLSGVISQAIGRKLTMQLSSVFIIVSWIIFKFSTEVWQIYVALVIMGSSAGLLESPIQTYVAEITQPHLRGSLLSSGPLASTLGIFLEFLLGSIFGWRTVSLYSTIFPLAAFIFLFFVPESPYWLIIRNRMQKAKKSLAWLRGWTTVTEIEQEFGEMVKSCTTQPISKNGPASRLHNYTTIEFIHPFVLLIYLFLLYQFSGLTTIPVYAVKIFETFETSINEYDATVLLGLSQFLGCLACVLVVPYIGRRKLSFITIIIAASSIGLVAAFAYLGNIEYLFSINKPSEINLTEYKWVPLVLIWLAAFMLNCGVRTLPWNMVAEVFTPETRSVAAGVLSAVCYCIGFGSSKVFLEAVALITLSGVFWLYSTIGLISIVVLYFWLPETEGKSLQDITDHFTGKMDLDNKVGPRAKESKCEVI